MKTKARKCRECGIAEKKVEFKSKSNICQPCHKTYMQKYRKKNRKKLSAQTQGWKENNRARHNKSSRDNYNTSAGRAKHTARVEKTHRTWLSHLLNKVKGASVDLNYLCRLLARQGGRCAHTGVEMVHCFNNLSSMALGKVNADKGYVKGNVQLICQGASYMARYFIGKDVSGFVKAIIEANRTTWLGADISKAVREMLVAEAVPVGKSGGFKVELRRR